MHPLSGSPGKEDFSRNYALTSQVCKHVRAFLVREVFGVRGNSAEFSKFSKSENFRISFCKLRFVSEVPRLHTHIRTRSWFHSRVLLGNLDQHSLCFPIGQTTSDPSHQYLSYQLPFCRRATLACCDANGRRMAVLPFLRDQGQRKYCARN